MKRSPMPPRKKPIARTALKGKKRRPRPRGVYCSKPRDGGGRVCPRIRYQPDIPLCSLHYADKLCRDFVLQRDEVCRRCGGASGKRDEWAHLYSRRYKLIRQNPLNSMLLCSGCHFWQTNNPLEGEAFFISQIGEGAWLDLRRQALADRKPDYEAVIADYLEGVHST